MLPSDIAKNGSEDSEQSAFFAYVNAARLHGFEIADRWAEMGIPGLSGSSFKATGVPALPYLEWMHAIPNGGSRGDSKKAAMIRGSQLKATGVKKGVHDIFLPYPVPRDHATQQSWFIHRHGYPYYHGLYIEMKVRSKKPKRDGSKGGMSDEQIDFAKHCDDCGYKWAVAYGWEEARDILKSYLNGQF